VIQYRTFRNTDPPGLVHIWNQCFLNRGAVAFRGSTLIEYCLFAKPYFDPAGLLVALDEQEPVGFILTGFGPTADSSALDPSTGVICTLGVLPDHRRRGIATELLRLGEEHLRGRGATRLFAGPLAPRNPFTFALYGGSNSPGFLDSDPDARPFFEKHGYQLSDTTSVLRRSLEDPLALADVRFSSYRQKYEIHARSLPARQWYREGVFGPIEVVEYRLLDRQTHAEVGHAQLWEMETFRPRWNDHGVAINELEIVADQRRRGLGKFLLAQIIRHLQEQFFTLVEMHVAESNSAGLELAGLLGFRPIDTGRCFTKTT
jgi:ribosomal protein S18 acetylase RimI-like enzyme